MKEPTAAQIKEFWEKWGFELIPRFGGTDMTETLWRYPDGDCNEKTPPIDLNNLFKYAVPKDTDIIINTGRGLANEVNRWIVSIKHGNKWLKAENEDPALALFWAIWECIKHK